MCCICVHVECRYLYHALERVRDNTICADLMIKLPALWLSNYVPLQSYIVRLLWSKKYSCREIYCRYKKRWCDRSCRALLLACTFLTRCCHKVKVCRVYHAETTVSSKTKIIHFINNSLFLYTLWTLFYCAMSDKGS